MTVIRTSVRKRLIKASIPFILTAASGAFVTALSTDIVSIEAVDDMDNIFVENMNDYQCMFEENVNEPIDIEGNETDVNKDDEQLVETAEGSEQYLMTLNLGSEKEDLTLFTERSGEICEQTYERGSGPEYIELGGGAQVRNCTLIDNETATAEIAGISDIAVNMYSDEPQVLIIHTHTTESYEPYTKNWYDERYTSRSFDPQNGVIAVGEAIAKRLSEQGIAVIHDCTVHDSQYNGAYTRSLETTLSIMKQYPSIKIVLDIHRDAIEYADGTRVSAVTTVNGRKAAQAMIICAADDGTYNVPDFYGNLHFACELQKSMESMFPTLTRPVLFQYCQYNQQVSSGALLIEVGSHGNSIDEAVYTGELIGEALAVLLKRTACDEKTNVVHVLADVPLYFFNRLK